MKRTKVVMVGLMAIILVANVVYAQPMNEKENGHKEKKEQMFKELGLTAEQQQQLEQNRSLQRQEKEKLRESMKAQETKLHEALKDPAATRASVEPMVNEIKALQAQMIESRINGILAVKQVLTPEQFVQFEQKMEQMKEEGKGHFRKQQGKQDAPDGLKEERQE
jgi:Spy/CpxP family protein refolding chaperone